MLRFRQAVWSFPAAYALHVMEPLPRGTYQTIYFPRSEFTSTKILHVKLLT